MAKKIKTIPATLNPVTAAPLGEPVKRKVAGYARVSTGNEDQANSYEAQVDYYTNYIKKRADWEFVSVYTDGGVSGTSTAKRKGFNQMVGDALAGRIDLIVTKSVSRFARNTVDSLSTIRKLKDKGCEVFFERLPFHFPQRHLGPAQAHGRWKGRHGSTHSGVHIFGGKIRCSEYGGFYGSKIWHSNDKYRRVIWRCNHKFEKGRACSTPHLTEEQITNAFVAAVNKALHGRDAAIAAFEAAKNTALDTGALEVDAASAEVEMQAISSQMQALIRENAAVALDQDEYRQRFQAMSSRYDEVLNNE